MKDTSLIFYGICNEAGAIALPKSARRQIAEAFRGKRCEVIVRRARKVRSSPQNRYYWGVVIPMVLEGLNEVNGAQLFSPASPDDCNAIHEMLKNTLLDNAITVADAQGQEVTIPPSTKRLTTTGMMEYTEAVRLWAGEYLGVTIPEPGEQIELF